MLGEVKEEKGTGVVLITEYLSQVKDNLVVSDAFTKADSIINNPRFKSALCSISGGADSDIMLDIIHKVDRDKKVKYVWFNTGLEYRATKDHLLYLEDRYGITIERERAIKPIPLCTKEFGQPFLSKSVSDNLERLQTAGFQFENKPYDVLIKKYPTVSSPLKWWCNEWDKVHVEHYGFSRFSISLHRFLKDFLIENPPPFKISVACCAYAKKKVGRSIMKRLKVDLSIIGVRQAEGGARATAYKSCFDDKNSHHTYANYRPIFWFQDGDKAYYNEKFGIVNSDCYTKWGFKRTGCVGCPYNKHYAEELEISNMYEPMMYVACKNVFKESYEYTQKYREYIKRRKDAEKGKMWLF